MQPLQVTVETKPWVDRYCVPARALGDALASKTSLLGAVGPGAGSKVKSFCRQPYDPGSGHLTEAVYASPGPGCAIENSRCSHGLACGMLRAPSKPPFHSSAACYRWGLGALCEPAVSPVPSLFRGEAALPAYRAEATPLGPSV